MPIHDWTRVDAGVFHHFHGYWVGTIAAALNDGVLPRNYYALIEQVAGRAVPDMLTLSSGGLVGPSATDLDPTAPGGTAVSAPARTRFHERATIPYARRPKSVAVRHVSGDRVVAMVEIVSPGNKSNKRDLKAFVEKVVRLLQAGIHVLVLDLFPPGPRDRNGIHRVVWSELSETRFKLPADKRLTLASYIAGPVSEAYVETVAVGDALLNMPLFLNADVHVPVPLEASYQAAWVHVPSRWRDVIAPPG